MKTIRVPVLIEMEVPDDYDVHDSTDALKWHLHLLTFEDCGSDPSPTKVTGLKEGGT